MGQSRRIHLLGKQRVALIVLAGTPDIQRHRRRAGRGVSGHVPLFAIPPAALGHRAHVEIVQGTCRLLPPFGAVFAPPVGGSSWFRRLHHLSPLRSVNDQRVIRGTGRRHVSRFDIRRPLVNFVALLLIETRRGTRVHE